MKIGFIGAGKVGCSLGKHLSEAGEDIIGYYSKSKESADIAATFTDSESFLDIDVLVKTSHVIFITTPDGVIEQIWNCIKKNDLKDKIICHFSGSLSSDIFFGIGATGATGCSVHLMYAFSDKFTSYKKLNTACITMEGKETALTAMKQLFGDKLKHKIYIVSAKDKMKYHAAAALASNYVVALVQTSIDMLKECGFSDKDAMDILAPMVTGNAHAVVEKGTADALTGPVERNDVKTVQGHLNVIQGTDYELIYRSLGKRLVALAEQKNPDRDYEKLKKLIAPNN